MERLSESIHDLEVKSVSQKDTIASLQTQLEQSQKLSDMYREQIIQLEDEMGRVREEGDIGKELFRVTLAFLTQRPLFLMFSLAMLVFYTCESKCCV